jgi:hypothetical protein
VHRRGFAAKVASTQADVHRHHNNFSSQIDARAPPIRLVVGRDRAVRRGRRGAHDTMPHSSTSRSRASSFVFVATITFAGACASGLSDEGVPSGQHSKDAGTIGVDAGNTEPTSTNDDAGVAAPPTTSDDAGVMTNDDAGATMPDGPDPFSAAPTCTSGTTWLLGTTKSGEMQPGVSCDGCHKLGGQATTILFDIAGTVYPTAHEPDQCYGTSSAQVVITDANGTDHTLGVNAAGNFWNYDYVGVGAIATPYTAKVVNGGKSRPMLTPQTNGDCNSCHTQDGASGALGRVILP